MEEHIPEKIMFAEKILSVQPCSNVWRYCLDNRTHRMTGYNLFLIGTVDDEYREFSVAISEKQQEKLRFHIGDEISGTAWTKIYTKWEYADFYRAGSMKKTAAVAMQDEEAFPPWVGEVPELSVYDLGHHADPREMTGDPGTTWFHDESYDDIAVIRTDPALTTHVYNMVKDTSLETTELTAEYMRKSFPGEEWADRQPRVLLGTSVTSDNFWKGQFDHNNALLMTETYGCADPYAVTEMEDIAVGRVLKSRGMLDRLIIIRDSVNVDVFTQGATPESLWGESSDDHLASDDSEESVDIFAVAMLNNYTVGSIIIDAVLNGEIR